MPKICNDWHQELKKKTAGWNNDQTDIDPEEWNWWGNEILSFEDWETRPVPAITPIVKSVSLEPITLQESRFEQNLKIGIYPHGIRWYHASTKCFNCTLDILKEEKQLKKEKDMINMISEDRSLTPPGPAAQGSSPNVYFFLTQKDTTPPYQAYEDDTGYDLITIDTIIIYL